MNILRELLIAVLGYLKADWLILLIGILIAVSTSVYIDSQKLNKFLKKKAKVSIPGAVGIGALTPLCACGTMAVLLSMFISAMPWGAVMAFLISSPLSSPSEYIFETAFFGSRFATGLLTSSILLGLLAGVIAHILERKTNFFNNQFRLSKADNGSISCCEESETTIKCCNKNSNEKIVQDYSKNESEKIGRRCEVETREINSVCCHNYTIKTSTKLSKGIVIEKNNLLKLRKNNNREKKPKLNNKLATIIKKYKMKKFVQEFYNIGIKKILFYFVIFIAIGRIVELFIPKEWIMSLFSDNKAYSIPLAATIGLPLYLSDASAIPLLKSFINAGAGEGAVLAFLIAGKATGVPVIAGMSTFMKKRALIFYIVFIYVGSIVSGYLYQFLSLIKF